MVVVEQEEQEIHKLYETAKKQNQFILKLSLTKVVRHNNLLPHCTNCPPLERLLFIIFSVKLCAIVLS